MADVVPTCDSDEEVFVGPVTAREIELMWRSKLQEKNERKTEEPYTELRISVSSEQLVPSLELIDPEKPLEPNENYTRHVVHDSQTALSDPEEKSKNLMSSIIGENKINSFSVCESLNFIDEDVEMDVDAEPEKEDSVLLSDKIYSVHFDRDINSSNQVNLNTSSDICDSHIKLSADKRGHEAFGTQLVANESFVSSALNMPNEAKIDQSLIPKDFVDEVPFEKSLVSVRKDNGFEVFIPITPNHNEKFYNETMSSIHSKMYCNESVMSEVNYVTDFLNDKKEVSFCKINDNSLVISASATETEEIAGSEFSPEDNSEIEASKEAELTVMRISSCIHDTNIASIDKNNDLSCKLDANISSVDKANDLSPSVKKDNLENHAGQPSDTLNFSKLIDNHESSIGEHSSDAVSCTKTEISSSENVAAKRKDHNTADEFSDIELKIDCLDLGKSNTTGKEIIKEDETEIKIESDSDENDKSFVSLPPSDEINYENKEADFSYVPPDKKQCFQSTSQTEKENEDPKSRIPVPGPRIPVFTANRSKPSVLKPPTLKAENITKNSAWIPSFKKKKIAPPKKPDYVVSPNKLGHLLKRTPADKLNRPKSAETSTITPLAPRIIQQRAVSRSDTRPKPQSAMKSKLPTPTKISKQDNANRNTPLKNPMYEKIVSPVAEYIKNRTTIIRNVTPSGNLPNITPKKLQEPAIYTPKIAASPKGSLPPKYYFSADKRLVLDAAGTKASNLPRLGERQAAVFNSSPKYRVLKHIGRIKLEETNGEEVVENVEKQTRRTSLSETSFAHLPPAAGMDFEVSVLQEQ